MPKLRRRMKRLPACHRKTPVDKDDQCPNFYAMAKVSPLPEFANSNVNSMSMPPGVGGMTSMVGGVPMMGGGNPMMGGGNPMTGGGNIGAGTMGASAVNFPFHSGHPYTTGTANMYGADQQQQLQNPQYYTSVPPIHYGGVGGSAFSSSYPSCISNAIASQEYARTLQYENENLMLRMKLLEQENRSRELIANTAGTEESSRQVDDKSA